MKIFITGATGYIGQKLAFEAANRGYEVHALVRNPGSPLIPKHPAIQIFRGDINDISSLEIGMKGCEKVIHAAALTRLSHKDNSLFYKINVEGTRNVLDTALRLGIKKLVYTSTGAVFGPSGKYPLSEKDPRRTAFENDYEISKHWAEQLVKEYTHKGLFTIIVSAPRVYGPGPDTEASPINRVIKKVIRYKTGIIPSCSEVVANYAYIEDVVAGHFLALEKGIGGEKYILGGENISYDIFFQTIRNCGIGKILLLKVPVSIIKTWSALYFLFSRMLGRYPQINPAAVDRLTLNRALSCEKAKNQLGYSITSFREGIHKTILFLQNRSYE